MKNIKKVILLPKEVIAGIENYRRKQEIIPSFSKSVVELLKIVLEIKEEEVPL